MFHNKSECTFPGVVLKTEPSPSEYSGSGSLLPGCSEGKTQVVFSYKTLPKHYNNVTTLSHPILG